VSGLNVVDSSGWLEYLSGSDRADLYSEAIEDVDNLIVPVVSIYEVFKRIIRDRSESDALQVVAIMVSGRVVDTDLSLALEAAKLKLPLADSLVYATAQRFNATLWTQDVDFIGLPGVRYFPK
jgi:predicted nucleic acid-binding protein